MELQDRASGILGGAFCSKCGERSADGSYCSACGERLRQTIDNRRALQSKLPPIPPDLCVGEKKKTFSEIGFNWGALFATPIWLLGHMFWKIGAGLIMFFGCYLLSRLRWCDNSPPDIVFLAIMIFFVALIFPVGGLIAAYVLVKANSGQFFVTPFLICLFFGIYFSIKGNQLLWATGRYATVEELRRRERPWAWAGAVGSGVILLGGILLLTLYAKFMK